MVPTETRNYELMRYWPFAVGGLVQPLLAAGLSRWTSFPVAAGASMFACFSAAVWIFRARASRPSEGIGRSLMVSLLPGCAAGLVAGVLGFLLPWR